MTDYLDCKITFVDGNKAKMQCEWDDNFLRYVEVTKEAYLPASSVKEAQEAHVALFSQHLLDRKAIESSLYWRWNGNLPLKGEVSGFCIDTANGGWDIAGNW